MFAHDLKTPVVATAGLIRRLLQGKLGPVAAPQMTYLQIVDHELERLEKLITRFLEFARLDLRIMTPQPQVLDLLDECRQILNPAATAGGSQRTYPGNRLSPGTARPQSRSAPVPAGSWKTCLGNAVKFSPAHSRVTLGARVEDSSIRSASRTRGRGLRRMIWPISSKSFTEGSGRGIPRASDWAGHG